jgi:hypothetical protein
MRNRILSVVATIVSGVTLACNDAAVDQITAPPIAATPVQPVLNQYPTVWEYEAAGIPSAIGMRILTTPGFENDWQTFVVLARVTFEWANYVTASLNTSLVDNLNRVMNSGSGGVTYSRFLLPVSQGDTTLTVSISTHGRNCGLMGRHTYSGGSAQMAINFNWVQIPLWQQTIQVTSGTDMLQPACAPTPPPEPECDDEPATRIISGAGGLLSSGEGCDDPEPPTGTSDPVQVCYTIWREIWILDLSTMKLYLLTEIPIGVYCYYTNMT